MSEVDTGIEVNPLASARDVYNASKQHRRERKEARKIGFSPLVKECAVCGYARCRCEHRRVKA